MMLAPRSYYLHQTAPPRRGSSEKMGARSRPSTPSPPSKARMQPLDHQKEPLRDPELLGVTTAAPMLSSQPVVIPPRTPTQTATSTQTVRLRGHDGGRRRRASQNHKPNALPPAVAALLAITEIPVMAPRRRKSPRMDRTVSMDELIQEWKQDDSDLASSVTGSPLDLLLGRVDESEDEYGSLRSLEQEKGSFLTSRSISSESIASTIPPSLDPDAPSFLSAWDDAPTPDSCGRKASSERREKVVQSPPKEDCVLDHPLLHYNADECEEIANMDVPDIVATSPVPTERFKSFKSNLTASLQALKSAAKSFSNFTAPSVPPDDLLTRSLLSPNFTSEMRPKHLQGLPSPALRRYLNPQPTPISPAELSMQLHDALDLDDATMAPMIQMQTYERRNRSSSRKKRGSDPFSEAGRAASPDPAVRQREPRENGDFLRVIVLEMNMRRVGKLDAKAVGKARIWLPPRKSTSARKAPSVQSRVPDRWVGVVADADGN